MDFPIKPLITLLAIVNPIGVIPFFIHFTRNFTSHLLRYLFPDLLPGLDKRFGIQPEFNPKPEDSSHSFSAEIPFFSQRTMMRSMPRPQDSIIPALKNALAISGLNDG